MFSLLLWVFRSLIDSFFAEQCERIISLVRTPFDFNDEIEGMCCRHWPGAICVTYSPHAERRKKLTQVVQNFDGLGAYTVPSGISVAFCCIGHRVRLAHVSVVHDHLFAN